MSKPLNENKFRSHDEIASGNAKLMRHLIRYTVPIMYGVLADWFYQFREDVWYGINKLSTQKVIAEKLIKAAKLTTKVVDWECVIDDGYKVVSPTVLGIMQQSGQNALVIAGIAGSFDVVNPYTLRAAKNIAGKLVTGITKETQTKIGIIVRDGIKSGEGWQYVRNELRGRIGLNARQEDWIASYSSKLQEKGVIGREYERLMNAYREKQLDYRLKMVARTETMRSHAEGTRQAYKQTDVVGKLEFSTSEAPCDVCAGMHGMIFTIKDAQDIIPVHPHCRCVWLPLISPTPPSEI